jgi:hypothetical protein
MVSESALYERSKAVVAREVAGQTILVPVRGKVGDLDCIFTLNGVASQVWNLLDRPKNASEISHIIEEQFQVDSSAALSDVLNFLNEMNEQGLVHEVQELEVEA